MAKVSRHVRTTSLTTCQCILRGCKNKEQDTSVTDGRRFPPESPEAASMAEDICGPQTYEFKPMLEAGALSANANRGWGPFLGVT